MSVGEEFTQDYVVTVQFDYCFPLEDYSSVDDEYMFCDNLLVAPIIGTESDEREVYLPAGEWENFFTGESVEAGRFKVSTEGIPVYRKRNIVTA